MIWIFVVAAAIGVFVIAAVAVGRESFRLGHQLPASIFDLDEAVALVSDDVPAESQARLTYDEVRELIRAQLDYLQDKGIVGKPGREPEAGSAGEADHDVVVADEDAVAFVLGRVDEAGLDVRDDDAYAVIAALHRYLVDIGAVGPESGEGGPPRVRPRPTEQSP